MKKLVSCLGNFCSLDGLCLSCHYLHCPGLKLCAGDIIWLGHGYYFEVLGDFM